jgi:uncharacterized membrane protein YoaK (UPF0700 family)
MTAEGKTPFRVSEGAAAATLSLASGFADAIGYMQAGIFAANMTGNTVLMGIAIGQGEWHLALERTTALIAFFIGGLAGRVLRRVVGDHPALALAAEAALISLAAFATQNHALMIYLIAAAMGIQATAMAKFEGTAVSTVVITSTIARVSEIVADFMSTLMRLQQPSMQTTRSGGLLVSTWVFYAMSLS